MKESTAMRIFMVGAGGIVRKLYLPWLAGWSKAEVIAITSKHAESYEELANTFRVPGVADFESGLKLGPDMVFIHSSTETHSDYAIQAMQHGIPVFVDKPLAYSFGEAERVIEASARTGVPLFVGFNRRFAPFYVKAQAAIADPGYIVVEKHREAQWFGDARESLFDDFIHPLDTLIGLVGTVERAEMVVEEGQALIIAEAGFGKTAVMHRGTGYDGERLIIAGRAGRIEVEDLEQYCHLESAKVTRESFGSWQSIAWRRGFQSMLETIEQVWRGTSSWPISLDQLWLSHRVAESLATLGRFSQ